MCSIPGTASRAFAACGTIGWGGLPLGWTMKSAPTDLSSSSVAEATIDEPTTERQATSARPIIRAAPVAPVRRGLRSALRSAIRPTGPNIRSTTVLSTRTTKPASSGPITMKPIRVKTTPTPRKSDPSLALSACAAVYRAAPPAAVRTRPIRARTRPARPSAGVPASRRAAIGEIFPARRAGTYAATTVTMTPSASPSTGVVQAIVRSSVDRFMPMAVMSFIRPTATPIPAPTPRTEPTKPRNSASTSTDRLTCLRLEPMARIRPISRVRWATSIEKVLTMRKMPTRKAIPAKPSIAYFITSRKEPIESLLASAASCWVWSLYAALSPRAVATFFFNCVSLTPGSAVTEMWVKTPGLPSSLACAVAVSR